MIIHTENLEQVLAICSHFSIPINTAELEISFPYPFELKSLNGEPITNDELTFEEFEVFAMLTKRNHGKN